MISQISLMPFVPGNPPPKTAIVLCIAGFDPCGGAGLLADARAVAAFGAYALGVQTVLVPQNTIGVRAVVATAPDLLKLQLETLAADIAFDAIKIGLLPDVAVIEVIAEFLSRTDVPIVVDPVLAPTRGAVWSDDSTLAAMRAQILPRATMLTPNVPEAQILSGRAINDLIAMQNVARALRVSCGAEIVLLKGGHLENLSDEAIDIYCAENHIELLSAPRIADVGVRGTGCLLASAIAAQLAQNVEPLEATRRAKSWMTTQWQNARVIGQGRRVAIF